jgi:hypothetical protein
MLHSRFLTPSSRPSAITTIRRASSFFIFSSLFVLALNALSIFDQWSKHMQPSETSVESIANFAGYLLAGLVRNDWMFILFLLNGVVLRRYHSRVAAVLFIVVGIWGAGLGLFIFWKDIQDPAPSMSLLRIAGFLAIFFGLYFVIAGRSLAAAIFLSGQPKDDPPIPTAIGVKSV